MKRFFVVAIVVLVVVVGALWGALGYGFKGGSLDVPGRFDREHPQSSQDVIAIDVDASSPRAAGGAETASRMQLPGSDIAFVCKQFELGGDCLCFDTVRRDGEGPVYRAPFGTYPGLKAVWRRDGCPPLLLSWPRESAELPWPRHSETEATYEVSLVDEGGLPVAGAAVQFAVGGCFVTRANGMFVVRSDSDGRLTLPLDPMAVEQSVRIVGGALPLEAAAYRFTASPGKHVTLQCRRAREGRLRVIGFAEGDGDYYYRLGGSGAWQGPLQLGRDAAASLSVDGHPVTIGFKDPLIGGITPLGDAGAENDLVITAPTLAHLSVVVTVDGQPCQQFAVRALAAEGDQPFNVSVGGPAAPRLLGDYPEGRLVLRGVLPGRRNISIVPVDRRFADSEWHEVDLLPGDNEIRLALARAHELITHVVTEDGSPVTGALVEVVAGNEISEAGLRRDLPDLRRRPARGRLGVVGSMKTDEHGVGVLRVRETKVALRVRADGFISAIIPQIELPCPTVMVVLDQGGRLKVSAPKLGRGVVQLELVGGHPRVLRAAMDGHAHAFSGIEPGTWEGSVWYDNKIMAHVGRVVVRGGEESSFEVGIAWGNQASVRGIARGPEGIISNGAVFFWPRKQCPWSEHGLRVETDAGGFFEVTLPSHCDWLIGISRREGVDECVDFLYAPVVRQEGATAVYQLRRVSAKYVLSRAGNPVADTEINVVNAFGLAKRVRSDDRGVIMLTGYEIGAYDVTLQISGVDEQVVVHPLLDSDGAEHSIVVQ